MLKKLEAHLLGPVGIASSKLIALSLVCAKPGSEKNSSAKATDKHETENMHLILEVMTSSQRDILSLSSYAITQSITQDRNPSCPKTKGIFLRLDPKLATKRAMKNLSLSSLILATLLFTGCSTFQKPDKWSLPPKTADEVSVMNFNVENLFDTTHDEDRDDFTYLPLAEKQTPEHRRLCARILNPFYQGECLTMDWNEGVLKTKLKNISEVILGVDGNGPDNLILLEVENEGILKRLNQEYLSSAGYQTVVLIEGPDKRGIDVGFLSRFPLVGKPQLHKIPIKTDADGDVGDTRGILEVTVRLPNGDPLTLFGVHFPSQANPRPWRIQSSQFLMDQMKKKGPNAMAIGLGDFNITHEEEQESHIFKDSFPDLAISHFVGCQSCPGTHNYRKSWSFLDAQVYSAGLGKDGKAAYAIEPATIDVIRYNPVHLYKGKYPKRFSVENKTGVSDHFPLYSRLKLRAPAATPAPPAAPAQETEKK